MTPSRVNSLSGSVSSLRRTENSRKNDFRTHATAKDRQRAKRRRGGRARRRRGRAETPCFEERRASAALRSGEPRAASADAELILALYEAGIKLEVVRERIVEPRRAQPFANVHDLTEHVNKREHSARRAK